MKFSLSFKKPAEGKAAVAKAKAKAPAFNLFADAMAAEEEAAPVSGGRAADLHKPAYLKKMSAAEAQKNNSSSLSHLSKETRELLEADPSIIQFDEHLANDPEREAREQDRTDALVQKERYKKKAQLRPYRRDFELRS